MSSKPFMIGASGLHLNLFNNSLFAFGFYEVSRLFHYRMNHYDYLIVGSGLFGVTPERRLFV